MDDLTTMTYAVDGRIARITLNRPERGNGLTLQTPRELAACVEAANLDPRVHVIALAGNGKGFCGGYDLEASAEKGMTGQPMVPSIPRCSGETTIPRRRGTRSSTTR
jgi:enoyl-CoA hydratase